MAKTTSYEFKDQGNKAFQVGDYAEAERLYTQAIQKNSSDASFFTNRALTRLRANNPAGALQDADAAVQRDRQSMKAYHHAASAHLLLNHPNDALANALAAYDLCIKNPAKHGSSASVIGEVVLRAKKERWEAMERQRIRGRDELLDECLEMVRQNLERTEAQIDGSIGDGAGQVSFEMARTEKEEARTEASQKEHELRTVFGLRNPHVGPREVPVWCVDQISFNIMHDPVITKSGNSYERIYLVKHLNVTPTDPLTREKLTLEDCRPNLQLKDACEAFLRDNGWAVDY